MTLKERTLKAIDLLIKRYEFLLKHDLTILDVDATSTLLDCSLYTIPIREKGLMKDAMELGLVKILSDEGAEWEDYSPSETCPLCKIYRKKIDQPNGLYTIYCAGCPVSTWEGTMGCTTYGYFYKRWTKKRLAFWRKYRRYLRNVPARRFHRTLENSRYFARLRQKIFKNA